MTSANLNYHFSWTLNICFKIWANPGIFLFIFVLFTSQLLIEKSINMDSGCCSDGRVVVSNTRDPRFESGYRENLFTINCFKNSNEKTKEKEAERDNFFNVPFPASFSLFSFFNTIDNW